MLNFFIVIPLVFLLAIASCADTPDRQTVIPVTKQSGGVASETLPVKTAEVLRNQAQELWQQGAKDHAIAILDNAITQFPNDWENYSLRGEWLGKLKRYDTAIVDMRRVTELVPYVGDKWGQLGSYLIMQGNFSAAQVASVKAQALAPDIANWAVNLGHTYLLQGDRNTAHIWYQKSIALIPNADVLKNSILASFDELIKHGWQVEAIKAERDWYAQEAKFLVAKSTEANELLKQAERAIQQRDKERVLKEALEGEAHNKAHAREWAFYDEAESAYKRALAIREQFFGIDHPSVAIICAALADLMKDTMGSAITIPPLYERALAITKKVFGVESLTTARVLDRFAEFYKGGEKEKFSAYYKQALAIREKILGSKHPDVATTIDALMSYDGDLAMARRALAIREEVLGPDHQDTATSLITVAQQLMADTLMSEDIIARLVPNKLEPPKNVYAKNDCLMAEPTLKRALAIREQALSIDKYRVSQSRVVTLLAYCYDQLNQLDAEERLLEHDLAIKEQVLAPAHEDTIVAMIRLALFFNDGRGQEAKGEQLLQRAVDLREQVLGHHVDTIASIELLAAFYHEHKQYIKEEALLQRVVTTIEQIPGIDTRKIIYKINDLAEFYQKRGQYDQQEQSLQRALAFEEKTWGLSYRDGEPTSSDRELANLVRFYEQHKQDAKLEQLWQRTLIAIDQAWGATHNYATQVAASFASFYLKRGQYAKAEPLVQRVFTNIDIANSSLNPSAVDFFVEQNIGKTWKVLSSQIKIITSLAGTSCQSTAQCEKMDRFMRRAVDILEIMRLYPREKYPTTGSIGFDIDVWWKQFYDFYADSGQYDLLSKFFEYVLTQRTQALGVKHPITIAMMEKLARSYEIHGDVLVGDPQNPAAELEQSMKRNWGFFIRGPIENDVLSETEKRQRALMLYDQARQLYEAIRNFHGNTREYDDIIRLAVLYKKLGQYTEQKRARVFYVKARQLYKEILPLHYPAAKIDSPDVYDHIIEPLADVYEKLGEHAQAKHLLTNWLADYEAYVANKVGKLNDNDFDTVHYRGDVKAKVGKIANFYYAHGHYAQAWPLYQRYVVLNDYSPYDKKEIAERYTTHSQYQLLAELYEGKLAATSFESSDLMSLARVYQKQGKTLQALERARQATFFKRQFSIGADELASINKHLWLHLDLLGGLQFTNDNRTDLYLDKQFYAAEAFEIGQLYHNNSVGSALAQMAARFATGNMLITKLVSDREKLLATTTETNLQLANARAATCGNSCDMPGLVYKPSLEEEQLREHQRDLLQQKALMDQQLQRELPAYNELVSPAPIAVSKAQKLLADDEAMLVFIFGDPSGNQTNSDQTKDNPQDNDHGYVWLLTDWWLQMRRLPFGKAKLQERIAVLRQSLSPDSNPDMAAYPVAAAHDLYKDLMGPEASWLDDKRTLFIVADGALEQLPLAVLVTEPPKGNPQDYQQVAWLARKWATVTLPTVSSLRALREIATVSTTTKPFIGFGDPNFSGMAGSQRGVGGIRLTKNAGKTELADPQLLREIFVSLPETADELRTIAKTLGAGTDSIFLGDQAAVPKVVAAPLSEYKVVYFATHALVAGQVEDFQLAGVEPAIVLTPPQVATPENDGLLRASRVAQLKLNADWVVLSACNTAAAESASSMVGLSGLAKAFFYAGARALLVSHWSVLSKPAVDLTTTTFQEWQLNPGIGRAEALRRAQMSVLDHPSNPHYSHPQAWAPFVVVGEGGVGR